jgi:hypothetical protein
MVDYKGIEKVDVQSLIAQRALAEALWLTLQKQGMKEESCQRVECLFVIQEASAVASLLNAFPETAGWNHIVSEVDDRPGAMSAKIISPPTYLSREALLELVDVMMIAAHESGSTFDGFNLDLADLQRRSWWRRW